MIDIFKSYSYLQVGNALSGVGAFLLFLGYYIFATTNKNSLGFILNALGSLLLTLAFLIFTSYAFALFNFIWLVLSLNGYLKNQCISQPRSSFKEHDWKRYHFLSISFLILAFIALLNAQNILLSWACVSVMLCSYMGFSERRMSRGFYLFYLMCANILSIPYLINIQNYASSVQTALSIILAMYFFFKELKLNNSKKTL